MKLFKRVNYRILPVIAITILLSACGSSDKIISDVIDDIDTDHQTKINYVNGLGQSTIFYTKSTVYPNSVFNSDHRVVEIMANDASNLITHKWINGARQTEFAIEDSNSASARKSTIIDLQDNKEYWSVAWQHGGEHELSIFAKESANTANQYSVRVFANSNVDIWLAPQQQPAAITETGHASQVVTVNVCSDLRVGNTLIDLCQSANLGGSYLVVVDTESDAYVIIKE